MRVSCSFPPSSFSIKSSGISHIPLVISLYSTAAQNRDDPALFVSDCFCVEIDESPPYSVL